VEHFHPTSVEDMMEKYPQGSEENTYIRMLSVIGNVASM